MSQNKDTLDEISHRPPKTKVAAILEKKQSKVHMVIRLTEADLYMTVHDLYMTVHVCGGISHIIRDLCHKTKIL